MVSTTLHQKLPILIIIMSRLWLTAETGHLLLFLTFYEVHALDYKARKKCSYGSYACEGKYRWRAHVAFGGCHTEMLGSRV